MFQGEAEPEALGRLGQDAQLFFSNSPDDSCDLFVFGVFQAKQ